MAFLGGHRHCSSVMFCLLIALLLACGVPAASAQTVSEIEVKAAFLFNLTQFVAWPVASLPRNQAPFVIGILGEDPFGDVLDQTVQGEAVEGRKIVVERYTNLAAIKDCQILFIGRSEERHLDQIWPLLKDKPVLTVADMPQFAKRGGTVNLITEHSKVRIAVNVSNAQANQLIFSSNLLRVAEVIGR